MGGQGGEGVGCAALLKLKPIIYFNLWCNLLFDFFHMIIHYDMSWKLWFEILFHCSAIKANTNQTDKLPFNLPYVVMSSLLVSLDVLSLL